MFISIDSSRNKCCILHDSSIYIMLKVLKEENSYSIVIKKFKIVSNFYDVGVPSSLLGVYQCSSLDVNFHIVSIDAIKAKRYLLLC